MADRRAGGTIPHVRTADGGKAPRARNKNGQWRKNEVIPEKSTPQ